MIDIASTKPTLMLGLSAQDAIFNLVFATAAVRMPWPWPGVRPAYVFSEDALGASQEGLLKNVYNKRILRRLAMQYSQARDYRHMRSRFSPRFFCTSFARRRST